MTKLKTITTSSAGEDTKALELISYDPAIPFQGIYPIEHLQTFTKRYVLQNVLSSSYS